MRGMIGAARVRSLLRIAREGQELAAAGEDPRDHVLRGLAGAVDAAIGIVAVSELREMKIVNPSELHHFGWRTTREEHTLIGAYLTMPPDSDPLVATLMRAPGEMVTRHQNEVERCDWIREDLHRPASVDASLVSLRWLSEGNGRVVVLKRAWGARPFDDEDCDLIEIFRAEYEPLLSAPFPSADQLAPRERETLDLLMTGMSEKEIAAKMNVSCHTAHDYVKGIYRKLGVRSRPELMALPRSRVRKSA